MANKDIKNDIQSPTTEQMQELDGLMKDVGYTYGWEEFAKDMYSSNSKMNFAKSLSSTLSGLEQISLRAGQEGIYQPKLSQELLQEININPKKTTAENIETMLCSPQRYSDELNSINQYLAYAVGVYRRNIWYNNTIKSFKYFINPVNIPMDNFDEEEYKKSYGKAMNVLRKLNIKYQIPKIDLQVMYDGFAVYYIAETSDTLTFIPLPSEACSITAPYTFGWRVAVDLSYFDKFNLGLDAIPELKEAYSHFIGMRQAFLNGDKTFQKELTVAQYYPMPVDKTAVFTFDPIHPDKVPPLSSAMSSALDILSYKKLLKSQLGLDIYKLIGFSMPLDKDNRPSMTYDEVAMIIQVVKGMLPENVVPIATPFKTEAINVDQTKKFEDIIKISNDSYYSASGASQALFGSSELRQGTALKLSEIVDHAYVSRHMYSQFNNCVNNLLWNATGKYKFRVTFFGNVITDKEDANDYASLVKTANMPVSKLFAYEDFEPFEIYGSLKSEDILGIKDLMKPLVSAFNSGSDAIGQPKKNRVSDGGEMGRDYEED